MNERFNKRIPHNCILKTKGIYDTLKKAEKKGVDFILKNPEEITSSSIVEVAKKAGCSEATLVRISKKLGYEGFVELKADFINHNKKDVYEFEYEGFSIKDDFKDIIRKTFDNTINALKDTLEILNIENYEKALNALLKADKIFFCGVGDGAITAKEAYNRFLRIGERSLFSEDPDIQLIFAAHLKKGDVFFAFSHSGKSKTVINTAKIAKKSGATIIAVTNFPVSPLTKNTDIVLLTAAFTKHFTGEVISKRVTELCILESLYINYLFKKGKNAREKLNLSESVIALTKI